MSDKFAGAEGSETDNTGDTRQAEESTESPTEELQQVTEEVQNQLDKLKQEYLYLRAEFDTYRRNAIKERADLLKYGSERLAQDLLGVLDNFERALETKATPDNLESYVQGVQMTAKELQATLTKHGIEEVPTLGETFDPSVHEALTSEETDEIPPGHISRVFKKAYKMHDKVIRPAQVVVAKEKSE